MKLIIGIHGTSKFGQIGQMGSAVLVGLAISEDAK
jgi:hypothetical protein